jgi:transposase InsO family protein
LTPRYAGEVGHVKAQLVITAVVLEGRSKSEVARDYDVSRYWVQQLVKRYATEGAAAFEPRSRRPHHNPRAVGVVLEDKIVRLRKTLDKAGDDAGAAPSPNTSPATPPSSTSLRCPRSGASCRGAAWWFPSPTNGPARRGNASELPNQRWQADVTHWRLADHTEVEIFDLIDDHSRLALASHARAVTTGPDVVYTFIAAFTTWGTPAGVLTDNGAIFTAKQRGDERTALEITLGEMGIKYSRSRPYHPQTCLQGRALPPNTQKAPAGPARGGDHHRAATPDRRIPGLLQQHSPTPGTATPHPIQAFNDRPKALPTGYQIPPHYRIRHDKIDAAGVITIRHNSRLHHIGLSKHLRDTKVTVLIDDLDIRVLHHDTGQLIRKLVLDPTRDYQPRGVKCGNSPENRP